MIQKIFLFLIAVLAVGGISMGQAQAGAIASIGTAMNYQLAANGREYEAKTPFSLRGGYRFRLLDAYAEYSYFSNPKTGTEMVEVGSKSHEVLLWARKRIPYGKRIKPFGAIGAGVQVSIIETRLDTEVRKDAGQLEGIVAGAAGVVLRLHRNIDLTFEGRVTSLASASPNPMFGLGCFLGVLF